MTSRTAGLLSVLLAAALAAGCSSGEDAAGGGFSGGGGGALSCPVPVGPLAFAVSGRSNSPEPGLPQAVQDATTSVLTRAVDEGYEPRVTLVNVDGRPVSAGSETFSSDAGNGIAAEDDRNQFLNGFGEAVTGLRAQTPEVDVLTALDLAGRSAGGNRPGTVVLVDSGLSTVAPLDFRQRGLLDAPPDETVEALRANNALPGLQGETVVLAGLGDVAEPQPALSPAQRSSLVALWTAIATAGGASCVAVVDEPRGGDAPSDAPAVSVVDVPPPPTITPGQTTALPDDNSVGFQPGHRRVPRPECRARRPHAVRAVPHGIAVATDRAHRHQCARGHRGRPGRPLDPARGGGEGPARRARGAGGPHLHAGGGQPFPGYVNDVGPGGRQLPGPASANRTVIVEPSG